MSTRTEGAVGDALLEVRDLRTSFDTMDGTVRAVDGVSFDVRRGRTLGVVGESGCGKSVTALSILRLIERPGRIVGGSVTIGGRDLLAMGDDEIRSVRGDRISMIFQEPMTSLNPLHTIERQINEVLILHKRLTREAARRRTLELLEQVGIPDAAKRLEDRKSTRLNSSH